MRLNPVLHGVGFILLVLAVSSCGSSVDPRANRTFYSIDDSPGESAATKYEIPLPRLDAANPRAYKGMTILGGTVRISRPQDWVIRRAAITGDRSGYLEYLSPRGFIFAIYERRDSAGNDWGDIDQRYEEDVNAIKANKLSKEIVPIATANAQGRAFLVEHKVPGARAPYVNTSREVLLRGSHRVVLVEIVFEGASVQALAPELLHVFDTLEVE